MRSGMLFLGFSYMSQVVLLEKFLQFLTFSSQLSDSCYVVVAIGAGHFN